MEAGAVTTIPLDQLRATRINVRRTGGGSIDDLAASIAHHGLIHNLTVIKGEAVGNGGTGGYLVVAGSRRLKALTKLQAASALPAALVDGIPCRIVDRDEGHEASLAENVIREAMHPADEFDAFHSLANDGSGCSTAEIAARFGKSELYVRQRLKLANVAPSILDEYRAGKATLEQMMALALTDDQAQQLRVWKGAKQEWQRRPDQLRSAITQKELAATSKLAKFIGVDAYEKAGGEVRRDIFGSDADAFLVDVKLANKLAEEKLERTAEKIRKEGWAWVEARIEFPYSDRYAFGTAQSTWKGSKQTWTEEAKSHAGVVVSIAHNGQTEIERGLVRPQDRKAAAKAGGKVSGGCGGESGVKGQARPWSSLDDDVLRQLHAVGHGVSYIATFMVCCRKTVHARAAKLGLAFHQRREWTSAEDQLLRDRFPDDLTEDLARKLGRTTCQVYNRAHTLGLAKSAAFYERERKKQSVRARTNPGMRASQFQKGLVPANKGVKRPAGWGPGRMRETQFKKGRPAIEARNYVPIGTEKYDVKRKVIVRKVTDDPSIVPVMRWRPVHVLVWEAAHGPVPPGHIVIFKKGRKTFVASEITVDRLELVTLAENMRRNSYHTNYPKDVAQLIQLKGALNRKINKLSKGER